MCSVKADTAPELFNVDKTKPQSDDGLKRNKNTWSTQTVDDSPQHDFMVDQSRPADVFFMYTVSEPRQESHRRSDQDCSDWRASPPALQRSCVEFNLRGGLVIIVHEKA